LFGKQLVGPVAVRSDDFKHVYFVAGLVDGEPALWAMNQLDGGGLIMSINQHAYDVSEMEFGDSTDAHVTENDDGAFGIQTREGSLDRVIRSQRVLCRLRRLASTSLGRSRSRTE